jgi:tetratricopeptide (TPR) repeat protein
MARKALSLDDSLAEAYAALGNTSLFADWNVSDAEKNLQSAIDLNPSYATAHQWYAYCFLARGDLAGALKEIRRAQEADPLSPSIGVDVGNMLFYARRYEDALAEYRRVLELEPDFAQAHQMVLAELLRRGDLEAARQEAASLPLPGSSYAEACLAVLAARSGDRRLADEHLERVVSPERWTAEASVALALGDKEGAVAALEEGYRRRDAAMLLIGADPRMDPLRSDPRFADLVHRVGVVPVERARP